MAKLDLQPVLDLKPSLDLKPVPEPAFRVENPFGEIEAAPEPSWWESQIGAWKEHAFFPTEEGYNGGRWTRPGRAEKLYRTITFLPRVTYSGIGSAIERLNIAATGLVRPLFAAVGKGRLETIETGELRKYPESVFKGLKTALRKPGDIKEAPTFGKMLAEDWYEPLVGEKPPAWYEPVMTTSADTILLFGPRALRQYRMGRPGYAEKVARVEAVKKVKLAEAGEIEPGGGRLARTKFKQAWKTVSGRLQRAGEPLPEATLETEIPIQKLSRLVRAAKRIQPQFERIKHITLQQRAGKAGQALEQYTGEKAWRRAAGALKGRITAPDFTPPGMAMSPAEKGALAEQLRLSKKLLVFDKIQAKKGLESLLAGYKPQPNQLELLEREFGSGIIKSLLHLRTTPQKIEAAMLDILNMPRTLLTSYDLSASLRQNYIAGLRHPKLWSDAFVSQIKAFGSEEGALTIENTIRTSKYWPEAVKYKLYQPSISGFAEAISARPEEFMSRFAHILPGVKASERAFVTFGNKMRFDLFSKTMELWKGTGKKTADYKLLANYVNALTGRGKLPFKVLEQNGAAMNALFFSPKWLASRVQLLNQAAKAVPWGVSGGMIPAHPVSKMAAADITTFVGTNTAILAAVKFYWGDDPRVDVEIDPRSSDFGKVRIGNSRFEAFAGYQPLARYTVQALTGEQKQAITGRMFETTPTEVGKRFLRSKLAPAPSFVVDMWTGTTFVGDKMEVARLFGEVPGQAETVFEQQAGKISEGILFKRLVPLAGQDILDAAVYQGAGEALITTPAAILGIGTGTWPISKGQKLALQQDEASRRRYGKAWDETGPLAQKLMSNINPDWKKTKESIKFEREKIGLGQMEREQVESEKRVLKMINPQMRQHLETFKVRIGGVSRMLGDWRLNKDRYQEYQNLVAENINRMSPSGKTNQPLIKNIIRRAKKNAQRDIKIRANQEDFSSRRQE
jgi:hypothetical protein